MHYKTLSEFVRTHGILLPKPKDGWRLVQHQCVGQINGLPNFRGVTIATNGIMVALENECRRVVFGHIDWFEPDTDNYEGFPTVESPPPRILADYV